MKKHQAIFFALLGDLKSLRPGIKKSDKSRGECRDCSNPSTLQKIYMA